MTGSHTINIKIKKNINIIKNTLSIILINLKNIVIKMIENKLEIMIPTYNRYKYLDRTLNFILNSPFKNCKITVQDNASNDDTPYVCKKYLNLFKNLHIIRHDVNIGGNANIVRCYEEATAKYIWVIADNDILKFNDCEDFIEAIISEKYDLILCSSGNYMEINDSNKIDNGLNNIIKEKSNNEKNYLENSAESLISKIGKYYFSITLFIPSVIYKTSLIDSQTIIEMYDYISRSFPHMALSAKVVNENLLTYSTKKDIVLIQTNPTKYDIEALNLYSRRLNSSFLLNNAKYRSYVGESPKGGILYEAIAHTIVSKAQNEKNNKLYFADMINNIYKIKGFFKGLLYVIPLKILFYLVPKKICSYIVNKNNENKGN